MIIKKHLGIILMLLCAVCLCFGQLVWKLNPDSIVYIFGGFGIFIIGFVSMILALRCGELSVLQPINSMSYVFAALAAHFILKTPDEEITLMKIAGIILIVGGVIVMGRGAARDN